MNCLVIEGSVSRIIDKNHFLLCNNIADNLNFVKCENNLKKNLMCGDKISIVGRVVTRHYDGKDSENVLLCEMIQVIDKKAHFRKGDIVKATDWTGTWLCVIKSKDRKYKDYILENYMTGEPMSHMWNESQLEKVSKKYLKEII